MSELTIKLIIILLPGAIATLILGKLIIHKKWDNFTFILISILFGFFSFIILKGIISLLNLFPFIEISDLTIFNNLNVASDIPYQEVIFSSLVAIVLSYIISFVENKKYISRIARVLHVSNKYGEEDLFTFYLNRDEVEWVYVRCAKNNVTYLGWVNSFSETDNISEIFLSDVSVYSYDKSKHFYDTPEIYLSFNKTEIIIELATKHEPKNN